MKHFALAALFLSAGAVADPAHLCPSTQAGADRLLLTTSLGQIVIALYSDVAPKHAAQIARLANAGVYDGTPFLRIIPGFAAQLGGVARRAPITGEQVKLITRIPAEFNACPHRRGTISMAHDPEDVNSAQTSFLVMMGEIPQMNGKFTVVGEVVSDDEILEQLEHVALNPIDNQPLRMVEVKTARMVSAASVGRNTASNTTNEAEQLPAGFALLAIVTTFAGAILLALAWNHRARRALGMLWLLAGGFGLFAYYAPLARKTPGLPLVVFALCIGAFKLFTYFETEPSPVESAKRR